MPVKAQSVIGVLDVMKLGLWEVVGTPIEALNQGDKIQVTVLYDKGGNALEIHSSKLWLAPIQATKGGNVRLLWAILSGRNPKHLATGYVYFCRL